MTFEGYGVMSTVLLDKLAVARQLQVHKNTIDAMVRDGRLPKPLDIGTPNAPKHRWHPDVIQEWIDAGCPRQTSAANTTATN